MVFRYIKFDTFTPAADRGLPVTRVISRMTLQQILARAVGDDAIMNDCHVVDFKDDGNKVNNKTVDFSDLSRTLADNVMVNSCVCIIHRRSAGYCHIGGWAGI